MLLSRNSYDQVPRTAVWIERPDELHDPIGHNGIGHMQNPVMIPAENGIAYDLDDIAHWHLLHGTRPSNRQPFKMQHLVPVRYPGFPVDNYNATIERLQHYRTDSTPYTEPEGEPSLEDGMAMLNPFSTQAPAPAPDMDFARAQARARAAQSHAQWQRTQQARQEFAAQQARAREAMFDRQWLDQYRRWRRTQEQVFRFNDGGNIEKAQENARQSFIDGMLQVANIPHNDQNLEAKTDLLTCIARHFFNHNLQPVCASPNNIEVAMAESDRNKQELRCYLGGRRMLARCTKYEESATRGQGCLVVQLGRDAVPPENMTVRMYRLMDVAYRAAADIVM